MFDQVSWTVQPGRSVGVACLVIEFATPPGTRARGTRMSTRDKR